MKNLKNISKRALALLLTLVMCLGMVNVTVFAEEADPASTGSETVYTCGKDAHEHTEACYEVRQVLKLVCEDPDHGHNEECYAPVLVCGLEESDGHKHGDTCYETRMVEEKVLKCGLEESELAEGHQHTDACYETGTVEEQTLSCAEDHAHDDACYETTTVEEKVLKCGLEESAAEGHQHTDACYETSMVEKQVLTCETEESEGHQHSEKCYETEKVLVCETEEHTHTEECKAVEKDDPAAVEAFLTAMQKIQDLQESDAEAEEVLAAVKDAEAAYDALSDAQKADETVVMYYETLAAMTMDETETPTEPVDVSSLDALKEQCDEISDNKVTTYKLNSDVKVTGKITIDNDNFTLDLNGHTVKFALKPDTDGQITQPVFRVESGTLTIEDSAKTGKIEGIEDSSAALIVVIGGTLNLNGGTLTGHHNTPASGNGAAIFNKGTVVMSGGTISNCTAGGSGGAIYNKGTFTMSGGTISGNKALGTTCLQEGKSDDGGGAVYVAGGASFTMTKGAIRGNEARAGGGIYLDRNGSLTISGGTIEGNTANGGEEQANNSGGGGIFVNGTAEINPTVENGSPISITDNTSKAKFDLGGGGIYVNSNYGKLTLINAEITDNTAAGLGGGVATCIHGKIAQANIEGAAIYGNRIMTSLDGNKITNVVDLPHHQKGYVDASELWALDTENAKKFREAAVDILSSGNENKYDSSETGKLPHPGGTIISDLRLGGGKHGWSGYTVKEVDAGLDAVTPGNNGAIYAGYAMALTASNTALCDTTQNTVLIKGNKSASQGGGVACNGILVLSKTNEEINVHVLDGDLDLTVNKTLNGADLSKNDFTFVLKDEVGKEVDRASTKGKGSVTLNFGKGIDQTQALKGSYTFYVEELSNDLTKPNSTKYTVTVNVAEDESKKTTEEVYIDHQTNDKQTLVTHHYGATVIVDNNGKQDDLPFVNDWKTGSLKLDKTVVGTSELKDGEKFTFTVTLKDESGKGITIPETLRTTEGAEIAFTNGVGEVTIGNDKFNDELKASVTIEGIPCGLTYTVEETDVAGWIVSGEVTGDGKTIGDKNEVNIENHAIGALTIKKVVEGLPEDELKKELTFTFTVEAADEALRTKVGIKEYGDVQFRNGKATVEIKVNGSASSTVTIPGLPTGQYTVKENEEDAKVPGYTLNVKENTPVTVTTKGVTSEVTNTYSKTPENPGPDPTTTSLTVKKVWVGDDEKVRPTEIKVQRLRNGEPYGNVVTLSASEKDSKNWQYTWTGLSDSYTWSVKEVEVPEGYTCEAKKSGTTWTITNTYDTDIPDDPTPTTKTLSVEKVWLGDAGANRPDSVTVQIFKDNVVVETVTLNSANNWSWSKVLSEGELESKWAVGEINVPEGYTSSVSADGTSFTVTNSYGTTDIPEDPTPSTDVPNDPPPLVNWPPVDWPPVEIPEDPVPMVPAEPEVDIPEDPTPMVGVPQTGDILLAWYAAAVLSACGLIVLMLKKRKGEEN